MTHKYVPDSATVYTPQALAAAMVRAARGRRNALWLDPCVGDGAFVAQMAEMRIPPERIRAIDIAPGVRVRDRFARTARGVDFIDWAQQWNASVDHVVMNPPYVALSRVRGEPLKRALEVALADGKRLALKANYWCAFVLRAIECLRPNGSLVAVLPASWDFAKYAAPVRDSVAQEFGEVIVVRCASPLFPSVKEGSVVVACFRRGAQPCTMRRVEVADLSGTIAALDQVAEGKTPSGASVIRRIGRAESAQVCLEELIDIRIGAVTGDAHYFLLSEPERIAWGLSRSAVCPVLSRSNQLTGAFMGEREWTELRDDGARVWLFRPSPAALKQPAVRKYLRYGKLGGCNIGAFKISSRIPWYRTPLPRGVDGYVSGMSKHLPFLVLREMKKLNATNTLYVVRFRGRVSAAAKASLGLLMLTSSVRAELARHARVYADGLLKFEPSELGSVRVPVVRGARDAPRVLKEATARLLDGDEQASCALADAWLASRTRPTLSFPSAVVPSHGQAAVGG